MFTSDKQQDVYNVKVVKVVDEKSYTDVLRCQMIRICVVDFESYLHRNNIIKDHRGFRVSINLIPVLKVTTRVVERGSTISSEFTINSRIVLGRLV